MKKPNQYRVEQRFGDLHVPSELQSSCEAELGLIVGELVQIIAIPAQYAEVEDDGGRFDQPCRRAHLLFFSSKRITASQKTVAVSRRLGPLRGKMPLYVACSIAETLLGGSQEKVKFKIFFWY